MAPRQGIHHGEVPVPHEERHAARVEVVAHQHGGVHPEPGVGGRPAPPERSLVDHVVVNQGRRVEELDDAPEPHRAGARAGPERRAEQDQDGPEPLASGERDVLPEIADELDRASRPARG